MTTIAKANVQPDEVVEEGIEKSTRFKEFMDHQRSAVTEARKALEGLMPEASREHGKSAYQEFVEGYRNLFNSTIDDLLDTIERAKLGNKDDTTEN